MTFCPAAFRPRFFRRLLRKTGATSASHSRQRYLIAYVDEVVARRHVPAVRPVVIHDRLIYWWTANGQQVMTCGLGEAVLSNVSKNFLAVVGLFFIGFLQNGGFLRISWRRRSRQICRGPPRRRVPSMDGISLALARMEHCMSLSTTLTINGVKRTIELDDPRVTLLDLLRTA